MEDIMKNLMRKIRTGKYILRNALQNIFRNKMMLLASLLIMTATMFIFGIFYVFSQNVNYQVENVLNNEYEISIHLDPVIDDELAVKFEDILKKDDRIERYKKISKAEALEEYRKTLPEEEAKFILEDIKEDFLPISFNIKLHNPKDSSAVISDLLKVSIDDLGYKPGEDEEDEGEATPGPEDTEEPGEEATEEPTASPTGGPTATPAESAAAGPVENGKDEDVEKRDVIWEYNEVESTIKTLRTFQRTIGIIFSVILGLLIFYSIIVISNTIMLTVIARKREISIMKNIGATSAYIRGPFIIEGCLIGIVGAVIAFFIVEFAYNSLAAAISKEFSGNTFLSVDLLDYSSFSLELLLYFILLSAVIGGVGALLSVNKNIKS